MKTKFIITDKFFLGVISGILANIIENIYNYTSYFFNLTKYFIWHIAASAYFQIPDVKTMPALVVGMFTDYAIAAGMGIATVYLLYLTGEDFWFVKGLSVSSLSWLFVFGIILRLKIGRIDPIDAGTNLVNLIGHILLGILIPFIIIKLGEDTVK